MPCFHIFTFWTIIIIKLSDGYTVILNQYLSGCELAILTNLSFLKCLYDCQGRSSCLSVNYHAKMHLCVENLAHSDDENCHFVEKSAYAYVNKDGPWNTVLSQLAAVTKQGFVNVCGPPPTLTKTSVLGNKWIESGKALYTCTTSKRSSAVSTCQRNGSWSYIGDFCNPSPTAGEPVDPTALTTRSQSTTLLWGNGPTGVEVSSTLISTIDPQKTSITSFSLTPTPSSALPIMGNADDAVDVSGITTVGVNGITSQRISLSTSSSQSSISVESRMSSTPDSIFTTKFIASDPISSTVSLPRSSHTSPITSARTATITVTQKALESTSSLPIVTESPTIPSISSSVACIEASAPDCGALPHGDYQSCSGCKYYATCSPGGVTTRLCSPGLVWDDKYKICTWTSSTCVEPE